MATQADLFRNLGEELDELASRYRAFSRDQLFVLWFLFAYLVEDERAAAGAVTGGPGDRGVDGVFVDDRAKSVFVIQGKLRQSVNAKLEGRSDVLTFARLGEALHGEKAAFGALCDGIDPAVQERLAEARERLKRRKYALHLYYVTLGRCSPQLRREASETARPASFYLIDGTQSMGIMSDYLDGVAPPIRSLDLAIESGGSTQASGTSRRFDPESEIESWVFSMSGADVGELFTRSGVRLFARNIRGFLGGTAINTAMEATLTRQPKYFWYFNNGVTIVCDGAQKIGEGGRERLRVENPQVINGQQTTRVLAAHRRGTSKASVLVRVIRIPRSHDEGDRRFDDLVSRIVEATNWQNAIRPSDLMANDRQQVLLEREFRKLGYQYLRKRQTKAEARRMVRAQYQFLVKKEELAQAVAACELDPAVVRAGKERLFEERYYPTVFASSSAGDYLDRYWMMRHVSRVARGYPERAYAKWLVLHTVWELLEKDVKQSKGSFRTASETWDGDVLEPLERCVDALFKGALHLYRNKRGRGPSATDISTFFQRRGLHETFASFWRRGPKTAKAQFKRGRQQFVQALAAVDP